MPSRGAAGMSSSSDQPNPDPDGVGIISEIVLEPLETVVGAVGLRRFAGGMDEVENPPAGLFHGGFVYSWQRVGDSDYFEMNLEIPVGDQYSFKSLEEFARDLRDNPPSSPGDIRCKQFDFAIVFLLDWIKKLHECNYRHLGLITPQNVLLVQWAGWRENERPAETTVTANQTEITDLRVLLADVGFRYRPAGVLPPWLEPTNHYRFIWGLSPEEAYRQPFDVQSGIPALARLIAYTLEPDCGVQQNERVIDPVALDRFPRVAKIWKVLQSAIEGDYEPGPDNTSGQSALDSLTDQITGSQPSRHFYYRSESDTRPPPLRCSQCGQMPCICGKRPGRKWAGFLLTSTALLILLLLLWPAIRGIIWPTPLCDCCPEVTRTSPILTELQAIDALEESSLLTVPNTADAPESSAQLAANPELPIREAGNSVELDLILAAQTKYAEHLKEHPTGAVAVADTECVSSLLQSYYTRLGNDTEQARILLLPGVGTGGIEKLCAIQQDLKALRDTGFKTKADWERVYEALARRNKPQMDRTCGKAK